MLLQVGDNDAVALPAAIERTARRLGDRPEMRRYPARHFDVYVEPWLTPIPADGRLVMYCTS
ncbi:hypothetical protein [Mycobacterium colombiense]|uniref:hypothetical protein n=1 Tax=Mycobacterium colombiense TaxID=339268 RepID=UPI00200ABA9A|nr:hypothetical protein [Mycobacterium colombiense]MCK8646714.1 hypothetical protein [Mycobacterium colombiense]